MTAVAVSCWLSQFKVHFLGKSLEQGLENFTKVTAVCQGGLISHFWWILNDISESVCFFSIFIEVNKDQTLYSVFIWCHVTSVTIVVLRSDLIVYAFTKPEAWRGPGWTGRFPFDHWTPRCAFMARPQGWNAGPPTECLARLTWTSWAR